MTAAHGTRVHTMLALLEMEGDRQALLSLKQETGQVERNGLTLEITPPTAPDAYGGCWVSVYDTRALEAARPSPSSSRRSRSTRARQSPKRGSPIRWTGSPRSSRSPGPRPAQKDRTVYVKGYTPKDGTYVSAHTRSR